MGRELKPVAADGAAVASGRDGWVRGLRRRAFETFEEGDSDEGWGRVVEFALIALIVGNVIMVVLESVPSIFLPHRAFFRAFEYATVSIFAAEYALRLWCSVEDPRIGLDRPVSGRLRFAARPMMVIDFLSFAPFFLAALTGARIDLRALRVLRLLRLLKITRYVQGVSALLGVVYAERRALIGTVILLVCAVCAAGATMRLVEGPGQPDAFGTLPQGMWWAILTLSTVGYGDVTPHTLLGKLVAGLTMVCGLMLYAMPIGIISRGFIESLQRRQFNLSWSMVARQPLFADLGVEALGKLMDIMGAVRIADHARLAVAGAPAAQLWLIVSGRAQAQDSLGEGAQDEAPDVNLESGDLIGEEALAEDGVYRRTVVARTEMRLMTLSAEDLRRMRRAATQSWRAGCVARSRGERERGTQAWRWR